MIRDDRADLVAFYNIWPGKGSGYLSFDVWRLQVKHENVYQCYTAM